MKALILLGTLKTTGLSNTETLCEFLSERLESKKIKTEIVKLVDHKILPGTYFDMGEGDEWSEILTKIEAAEIVILATPVWWGNFSSEIQRVIERLDEVHDEILAGKKSRLEGKTGGIVITGDSDGAQNIIAGIANFYNAIGIALPPFATLSVLWDGQAKGKSTPKARLMQKYQKDYSETANKMVTQLKAFASRKR